MVINAITQRRDTVTNTTKDQIEFEGCKYN